MKVIATLAMIDEGETDWKVLAIDVNDPLANDINSVEDMEAKMPGLLAATVEWFKIYKMPDGKPPNQFAFDGKAKDKAFALNVIEQTHNQWKALMGKADEVEGVSRVCTQAECAAKVSAETEQTVQVSGAVH